MLFSIDREYIRAEKYKYIADCYFRPREVKEPLVNTVHFDRGISIDSATGNLIISPEVFPVKPQNEELLRDLVKEKIKTCKRYICALEIEAFKTELDKLFSYGIEDIDGVDELYYYKALLLLYEGKDVADILDKCLYKKDIEWLMGLYENPQELDVGIFKEHDQASIICAINKLFTTRFWNNVINLYDAVEKDLYSEIIKQFGLLYGLSLFNMQDNEKAKEVFYNLYNETKEERFMFYGVCADIRIQNDYYQNGRCGNSQNLMELLEKLDGFNGLTQYNQQIVMVTAITIESLYHLGVNVSEKYFDEAIERYDSYSKEVRDNPIVRFFVALCLELKDKRDAAENIYKDLEWRTEPVFAERYLLCMILNGKPEKAIETYKQLDNINVRLESIYLFALERNNSEIYKSELNIKIELYKESLTDMLTIAYFADNENPDNEIIINTLKELIDNNNLEKLLPYQIVELAIILAHCREIELLELVLTNIDDINSLSSFALNEICKALEMIAGIEYNKDDDDFIKSDDFVATEHIADMFLKYDVKKEKFLNIKILCTRANHMPYSCLKYSKELFELNNNESLACNIVVLLIERKEKSEKEYHPYIDVLMQSEDPLFCLTVADAMLILGKEDMADYYAYKALYFLNGEDDYNVFKSYFSCCNYKLRILNQQHQYTTVKAGMVVTLRDDIDVKEFSVCFDSETEFSDLDNHSMDIKHITPEVIEYSKLIGSGINQVVKLRDKKYTIVSIMPRTQYGLGYVFHKIQERPDMFEGVVWTISTEDVNEMISKVKELTDRSEYNKDIMESYHFEKQSLGIPIDSVAGGYDRYIATFRYLLYAKDEILYAGEPVYEDENDQKYIPTLSTLMLLAILERFDIMSAIKNDIIIPSSYIDFFKEQYAGSLVGRQNENSTLYFDGDNPVIADIDKFIPGIWEAIIDFCSDCQTKEISDEERIDFEICEGLSGERFVTGFRITPIHLDSLVLAKREGATYLCDDLFFRKIAANIGIRHINIVSIAQHYELDITIPFIIELSKTNYLYIPLVARDDDEVNEIYTNIMDGKRKKYYYNNYINRLHDVKMQILRSYFGDEYIDKLLRDNEIETCDKCEGYFHSWDMHGNLCENCFKRIMED